MGDLYLSSDVLYTIALNYKDDLHTLCIDIKDGIYTNDSVRFIMAQCTYLSRFTLGGCDHLIGSDFETVLITHQTPELVRTRMILTIANHTTLVANNVLKLMYNNPLRIAKIVCVQCPQVVTDEECEEYLAARRQMLVVM